MIVRVTVAEASSARELVRLLVNHVEAEKLCFEPEPGQVLIEVRKNPDRALVEILNVVEAWLGDGGRAATSVEIDERAYVLGAPQVDLSSPLTGTAAQPRSD